MDRRSFLKHSGAALSLTAAGSGNRVHASVVNSDFSRGAVRAVEFESRPIYRSREMPSYACWVSFFPGERGHWYLTCEEVTRPQKSYPRMSRDQFYAFSLPKGMDKAPLQMEVVMLESQDQMKTWKAISRQPVRFQHTAGSFGQARTKDGRFLRFVWGNYSLDENPHPGEILYVSSDEGKTWQKQPAFHDRRVFSYAHRLRTLRDGTLVLAIPFTPPWGPGTDCPVRACSNLNANTSSQMNLCFSYDQGRTWTTPLPIYGGLSVTETDFVELPSGDLLCFNGGATPGRQMVYRTAQGWVPAPYEKCPHNKPYTVPETIALTEDGLLVGCLRNSNYFWSDDLGLTWFPLEGIPEHIAKGRETYQPWIHYLGDGRFANAGHWGGDDRYGEFDQYVMIHFFRVERLRQTKNTRIDLVRDFDAEKSRWRNSYTLKLSCDGEPVAHKEIEFWFVERWKPGYEDGIHTLEERMKVGGEFIRVTTGSDGIARVNIPRLDAITNADHTIQIVVRFNVDRRDPDYKPAQTPQFEFYTNLPY